MNIFKIGIFSLTIITFSVIFWLTFSEFEEDRIEFKLDGVSSSFRFLNTGQDFHYTSPIVLVQSSDKTELEITYNSTDRNKISKISFLNDKQDILFTSEQVSSIHFILNDFFIKGAEPISYQTIADVIAIETGDDRLGLDKVSKSFFKIPDNSQIIQIDLLKYLDIFVNDSSISSQFPDGRIKVIIEFISHNSNIQILGTGYHITATKWNDLLVDSYSTSPIDFLIFDIEGKISTDNPKRKKVELIGAGDVTMENVQGKITIERIDTDNYSIQSRGSSSVIQINDKHLFTFEDENNKYFENLITTIIVSGLIGGFFFFLHKKFPNYPKHLAQSKEPEYSSPVLKEFGTKYHEHIAGMFETITKNLNPIMKNDRNYFSALRKTDEKKRMIFQHFLTTKLVSQKYSNLFIPYKLAISFFNEFDDKTKELIHDIEDFEYKLSKFDFKSGKENWIQMQDLRSAIGLEYVNPLESIRNKTFEIGHRFP